jgi:hypothetical protein
MAGISDNLVAQYKMDDNAASTVVLDSSGNGYHGTSVRNTSLMHTAGKIGGALEFNGTSDYINTNSTFSEIFRNSFTINLWVNLVDGQPLFGTKYLFGIDTTIPESPNDSWCICNYTKQKVLFDFGVCSTTGSGLYILADNPFPDNATGWIMVTCQITEIDASHISGKLYINGVLQSNPESISTAENTLNNYGTEVEYNLFFGAHNGTQGVPSAGSYISSGKLDDIHIYNKALSAAEVLYIYRAATCFKRGLYGGKEKSIYGASGGNFIDTQKSIYGGK